MFRFLVLCSTMSSRTPVPETLTATAKSYLKLFDTLDPGVIAAVQGPNYTHTNAPSSLSPPGPFTAATFADHLALLRNILVGFPISIKKLWPNPHLRQVVVWTTSVTQFHDHVKDNEDDAEWEVEGEYIFVLEMDESGKKVESVLEFLDSKVTEQLGLLAARAFAKKAAADGKGIEGHEGGK